MAKRTLSNLVFRFWSTISLIVMIGYGVPVLAQELVLSDFNGTGFGYTFSGFNQTIGTNAVRLSDPADGWGGAGISSTMDLSSYADGRFVVDLHRNPLDGVDGILVELIDSEGRTGKWPLSTSTLPIEEWSTLVTFSDLANPPTGVGDFQNLDLSNITQWQILGDWANPNPFDISFDQIAISTTVAQPDAYPGQDLNAPWRTEAATRIDQYRKADLQVKVTDLNGRAVPGASVGIHMQNHEFGFGSAVQAFRLRGNESQHETYKQKVAENFNKATIENNLKWPPWDGEWGSNYTRAGAVAAIDWLASQGIETRGHAAVWPGYSNLPQQVQDLLDSGPLNATQQQQLRDMVNTHIDSVVTATRGKLVDWDVVNEPRVNHDIMDNLPEGDQAMAAWFQRVAANDPDANLYLNDYGLLTSGGAVGTFNQTEFLNTAAQLIADGAGIDGLGFQSHFGESSLSGPEQIWEILDQYQSLGLKMQVTEFDFATDDQQLQADYTRDFMTAIFAHPSMEDFITWGFWEDAHWRPSAAMYDSDWNLKPNGQQYQDLVFGEWWTDETEMTNVIGEAIARGFKGEYQIDVEIFGQMFTQTITLGDGGVTSTFTLPFALGDFSGDGVYACDDVDLLVAIIDSGTDPSLFDLTGDGLVNTADLSEWLAAAGAQNLASGNSFLLGDANLDGVVDASDFNVWNSRKFSSETGWCGGDFNADGVTDASDFNLWNGNKFQAADTLVVPEPAGGWLWLCGLGVWFVRRRAERLVGG